MIACLQLVLRRTFIGRAIMAVAQDQLALRLMAIDPIRIKRIAFGISIATASLAGAFLDHHPAGRAVGRSRLYRPHLRDLRARRHGQPAGHGDRRHADRHRREPHLDVLRSVLGAGRLVRLSAADAGGAAGRPVGTLAACAPLPFLLICLAVGAVVFGAAAGRRQRLRLLRRLCGAAIRRAVDRLEHSRRLLRLRELRHRRVLRARRLFDGRDLQVHHRT